MLKDVPTRFSGEQAFEYCRYLSKEIGPRFTGTAGEHKAAEYIAKTFRSFGLKTRLQKFPAETFTVKKCTFQVRDGKSWRTLDAQPVGLSKSTPAGGVEGELVYIDCADVELFPDDLDGKIIMLTGTMNMADLPKLKTRGVKAVIFIDGGVNDEPIRRTYREYQRCDFGNMPMAHVKHMDGFDMVKRGLNRGRLTVQLTEKKSHCLNVIGELTGTSAPDDIVVICGHYDTSIGIEGASDNAGGTATMMELARVLSKSGSRRTLRFIAFAGEEVGLLGSMYYAEKLRKEAQRDRKKPTFNERTDKTELDKHRLVYNIDIVGAVLSRGAYMYSGVDDIAASVRLLGKEVGVSIDASKGPMSSDGSPLAAEGIPALQYAQTGGTTTYLHSTKDKLEFLWARSFWQVGAFSEIYLRRHITDGVAMPFPRTIPEDQQDPLKGYRKPEPSKKKPAARKKTARKASR